MSWSAVVQKLHLNFSFLFPLEKKGGRLTLIQRFLPQQVHSCTPVHRYYAHYYKTIYKMLQEATQKKHVMEVSLKSEQSCCETYDILH